MTFVHLKFVPEICVLSPRSNTNLIKTHLENCSKIYMTELVKRECISLSIIKINMQYMMFLVLTNFCLLVNTASRMESTSEEGKIQCSEKSAEILRLQVPIGHSLQL